MGFIDYIGRSHTTNEIEIDEEEGIVRKRYRDPQGKMRIPMWYAPWERKPHYESPYASPKGRFMREKRRLEELGSKGINVPKLIRAEGDLTLVLELLELTDLKMIFRDPAVDLETKLAYFKEDLRLLKAIHDLGRSHGDSYLKNSARLNREYAGRGRICALDLENIRIPPGITNLEDVNDIYDSGKVPEAVQVIDVLIATADCINLLRGFDSGIHRVVLDSVDQVYSRRLSFPLDARDYIFYIVRFRMGYSFFKHFSSQRTISTPP